MTTDPIKEIQRIKSELKNRKITPPEALKQLNKMRENIGLDPLEKLPKSWQKIR